MATDMSFYNITDPDPTLFNLDYLNEPEPWLNHPSSILGITLTAMALSAICVVFRLFVRFWIARSPGLDDIFVAAYLITMSAGTVGIALMPSEAGLGKHLLLITPTQFRMFLLLFYIANASYMSSTAFIKLSLLFQYLRIFQKGSQIRIFCIILIILISLWGAAFSFMAWVPCFPVNKFWDLTPPGMCYGFGDSLNKSTYVIHTVINVIFDMLVLALPIPLYFEKDTQLKSKMGLIVLFCMGLLVNVFALWRLVLQIQGASNALVIFDSTFYAPSPILLATLEVSLASICASVPIFWPILSERIDNIFVTKEIDIIREDRFSRLESRTGSEVELRETGRDGHYKDSYVMDQVDPLRPTTKGVETNVRSEGRKRGWFKK